MGSLGVQVEDDEVASVDVKSAPCEVVLQVRWTLLCCWLCLIFCWNDVTQVSGWASLWYVFKVVEIGFQPMLWRLCELCIFVELLGWSNTRRDCGIMPGQ